TGRIGSRKKWRSASQRTDLSRTGATSSLIQSWRNFAIVCSLYCRYRCLPAQLDSPRMRGGDDDITIAGYAQTGLMDFFELSWVNPGPVACDHAREESKPRGDQIAMATIVVKWSPRPD